MKARAGWHHHLQVSRYGSVGKWTIVCLRLMLIENCYDGGAELVSEDWALQAGTDEFFLQADLKALLGTLDRKALSRAITEQPVLFAEMVARNADAGRVLVSGQFFAEVVQEGVPDFVVIDPTVAGRRLRFQTILAVPGTLHERLLKVTVPVARLTEPVEEEILRFELGKKTRGKAPPG